MIGVRNLKESPYNAPGDWSDQTSIIMQWIADLVATGDVGFAPPGVYAYSGTLSLTNPVTIRGAGFRTVFQHLGTDSTVSAIEIAQSRITTDYPWTTLEDFSLFGSGSDGHGISFPATTNNQYLRTSRLQVARFGGDGINLANAQSSAHENLIVESNKHWGVNLSGGSNATTIIGGNIASNRFGGLWVAGANDVLVLGLSVQGNYGENVRLGGGPYGIRRITLERVHVEGANALIGVRLTGNLVDVILSGLFVTQQATGGVGLQTDAGSTSTSPSNIWIQGGEIGGAESPSPRPASIVLNDGTNGVYLSKATLLDGPLQNNTGHLVNYF